MADNRSLDLVSWRPGPTRAALETFIAESVAAVAPEQRVAVFDNDGTLWCEKPVYAQLDFFIHELTLSAHHRPELADVPEYSALLAGNTSGDAEMLEFSMSHDGLTMAMLIDHDYLRRSRDRYDDQTVDLIETVDSPVLIQNVDNRAVAAGLNGDEFIGTTTTVWAFACSPHPAP